MGTITNLSAINFSQSEDNSGATYGEDMIGTLQCAQTKAQELVVMLSSLAARLPAADPNIAAINAIVANLN